MKADASCPIRRAVLEEFAALVERTPTEALVRLLARWASPDPKQAAMRQLGSPPRGWLDIHRAAKYSGLHDSALRRRGIALEAMGLAEKRRPPSGRGKKVWWFAPESLHANMRQIRREALKRPPKR